MSLRGVRHHRQDHATHDASGRSGATLLLAILFLTVILTITAGLVTFARAQTYSLQSFRGDRSLRYSGDSALEQAIQMFKVDPGLGWSPLCPLGTPSTCVNNVAPTGGTAVTVNPACAPGSTILVVPIYPTPKTTPIDSGAPPIDLNAIAPSAQLIVTCQPTAGVPSGGDDASGNENTRDVTFSVTCTSNGAAVPSGKHLLLCDSLRVIASARVQFIPDNSNTARPEQRATIPQVVAWTVYQPGQSHS